MDQHGTQPRRRVWHPSQRPQAPAEDPVYIVGDVPAELSQLVEPNHDEDLHRYAYGYPMQPAQPAQHLLPAAATTRRHPIKQFFRGFASASVVIMAAFGMLVTTMNLAGTQLPGAHTPSTVRVAPATPPPSTAPEYQQIVAQTREVCREVISKDAAVCRALRIEVAELPEGTAAQVLFNVDRTNAVVQPMRMTLSPQVLVADQPTKTYYMVHEWNHIKMAQVAGTPAGLDKIQQQAAGLFGARTGKALTPDKGAELLTDCMTWNSGITDNSVLPSYFASHGVRDGDRFCSGWQDLLLG